MVMPRASTEWAGAAALWITAAGWAGAAERRFGSACVVTPDAIASAAQCLEYTRRQTEPTEVASDRGRLEVLARASTPNFICFAAMFKLQLFVVSC
jgi:hypothetical protein